MTVWYERDGILYTTKTMCNFVETWQHEARVYPNDPALPPPSRREFEAMLARADLRRREQEGMREFRLACAELQRSSKEGAS